MKTTIKSVLVLALSIVTFLSCSSKDDDDRPDTVRTELVNTWSGYLEDAGSGTVYVYLTLNSDGTGTYDYDLESIEFTWGATSNTITLNWGEGEIDVLNYILSDDGTTLTTTSSEGAVTVLYSS